MSEHDGMHDVEEELFESHSRIIRTSTAAGMRLMEMLARAREDRARREADGQKEAAAALRDREQAQEKAMRSLTQRTLNPGFMDKADDRDLAVTYVWAEAYAARDPLAREAHERLGQHIGNTRGDVEQFVDSHVRPSDLERVPAPDGQLSPTHQRAQDRMAAQERIAEANRLAAEQKTRDWESLLDGSRPREASTFLTDQQIKLASLNDDQARQFADIRQRDGAEAASEFLDDTIAKDPEAMRNMERWRQQAEADHDRGEADELREDAEHTHDPGVAEQLDEDAQRHDSDAELHESMSEQERNGLGRFREGTQPPGDVEKTKASSPEAAEALATSLPGRSEPALAQVKQGRRRAAKQRGVKGRHQSREHGQEKSR